MPERVSHKELLSFRHELLEEIPVAQRQRLRDIDHLLGWPPVESDLISQRYTEDGHITAEYADYLLGQEEQP